MATHFQCQSTEPLPHVYPTGLAQKSHGAVSQYEVYNNANKPHTQFPPPGWDFSQSSEDDSLPLLQHVPQPTWKHSSFYQDPDLCITPQKPSHPNSAIYKKNDFAPDPLLTLTPDKSFNSVSKSNIRNDPACNDKPTKHRVRFEEHCDKDEWLEEDTTITESKISESSKSFSPQKVYQPELYGDEDDDFEFKDLKQTQDTRDSNPVNSRTVRYTVGKVNDKSVYVPMQPGMEVLQSDSQDNKGDTRVIADQTRSTKNPSKSARHIVPKTKSTDLKQVRVVQEKTKTVLDKQGVSDIDHISTCHIPEENGTKRKVKVRRENQYGPNETEYTFPFNQNAFETVTGDEHMFARPEYNSTLRMKLEAEKLKASTVDIETALQKKLQVSDNMKTEINEKASSLVNRDGSVYSGLVSLTTTPEEMCQQAATLKTARAKQVKLHKTKVKDHSEPDLLEFYIAKDRQKETATYSTPGVPPPSDMLSTAKHIRAFDLYKHNRVWSARTNKK